MNACRMAILLGCLLFFAAISGNAADPIPKEKPTIECKLTFTGKLGSVDASDGGEVVITNKSNQEVDIGTTVGPLGFLDFKVIDPKGAKLKTTPFASFFSPAFEAVPHLLKPGESYRAPVSLLLVIPQDKRVEGTYKVKAVFTFKDKLYESREVDVKWAGTPK